MPVTRLLFPHRCLACGTPGAPVCAGCLREVGVVTPPVCERCGRPWEEPVVSCRDCPPRPVDAARAPFLYGGAVGRAIRGLKFSGWRALAPHLAGGMAASVEPALLDGVEAVCWVPLSARRRRRRGFDQAELLARGLGRRLSLPVEGLLRRWRNTREQARRGGPERHAATRGAFAARRGAPRTLLLVDDVLTTGATAGACAAALRAAGARRVVLVTAARAVGGPVPARCRGIQGIGVGRGDPL